MNNSTLQLCNMSYSTSEQLVKDLSECNTLNFVKICVCCLAKSKLAQSKQKKDTDNCNVLQPLEMIQAHGYSSFMFVVLNVPTSKTYFFSFEFGFSNMPLTFYDSRLLSLVICLVIYTPRIQKQAIMIDLRK